MSVLDQLWRGEMNPAEKHIIPGSKQEMLLQKYTRLNDQLLSGLTPEGKAMLSEMQSLQGSLQQLEAQEDFISGLRLGALLMLDLLKDQISR